jgi:hypothetical protein
MKSILIRLMIVMTMKKKNVDIGIGSIQNKAQKDKEK